VTERTGPGYFPREDRWTRRRCARGGGIALALTVGQAFAGGCLGDARSISLDSAKSRAPRIAALREAVGT